MDEAITVAVAWVSLSDCVVILVLGYKSFAYAVECPHVLYSVKVGWVQIDAMKRVRRSHVPGFEKVIAPLPWVPWVLSSNPVVGEDNLGWPAMVQD